MIEFPLLGGTVGFDIAFRPEIIQFAFKFAFKYFEANFFAFWPLRGHTLEDMV